MATWGNGGHVDSVNRCVVRGAWCVVRGALVLACGTGYAMAFPVNESIYHENPNYVTAWVTHGLLEAAGAGYGNCLAHPRRANAANAA